MELERQVREEMRPASIEGKEEHPVVLPKREDSRRETEKEIPKGKDPKVPSGYVSFSQGAIQMIVGTHQNAHTINPQWAQMVDTCVFKHTGKASEDTSGKWYYWTAKKMSSQHDLF